METLDKINSLLDRIENRVGGSAQIPFINPCPSGEEWLELRWLLNSLSNPSVRDIPDRPSRAWRRAASDPSGPQADLEACSSG